MDRFETSADLDGLRLSAGLICCSKLLMEQATGRRRASDRKVGAGDGNRTRDVQLGKLAFYR